MPEFATHPSPSPSASARRLPVFPLHARLALLTLGCLLPTTLSAVGFPNVPQTPGSLLSGLVAPEQGRTAILAFHNGILFSVPEAPSSEPGSDLQVRTWDLADPSNPLQLATWGVTPMPINAHGYLQSGDYLVLGANWPPEAPWSFRANPAPGSLTRTSYPDLLCAGVRGCLFQPFFVGDTWWSYNAIGGLATIERNGVVLGTWDHLALTGVVGHPFLIGNLLIFASDQSRTGVATYDVSDPSQPVLLDVLTSGGPGGYWPEIWGGDGKLYVVFPYRDGGNGMQVVDVTNPSDLRLIADTPLPGAAAMYAQFQDEFAFIGDHKVDMRTFESVLDLHGATVPHTSAAASASIPRNSPCRSATSWSPAASAKTRAWRSGRTRRLPTRAGRRSASTSRARGRRATRRARRSRCSFTRLSRRRPSRTAPPSSSARSAARVSPAGSPSPSTTS